MKSIKTGLTTLLTACAMLGELCAGSLPAGIMTKSAVIAAAEETAPDVLVYQGWKYKIEAGEITLFGYSDDLPEMLEVPVEIEGVPVKSIADNAFNNCRDLVGISIPDSVTSIGQSAFINNRG